MLLLNLFILCNVGGVYCCRHGVTDTNNNSVILNLDNIIFTVPTLKHITVVIVSIDNLYFLPYLETVGVLRFFLGRNVGLPG